MATVISLLLWFAVSIMLFVLLAVGIYKMAENDFCFTRNMSGRIKVIVAGEQVVKFVGWIPGYHVFSHNGEIVSLENPDDNLKVMVENDTNPVDILFNKLGITFVGIWPFYKVYQYTFKWTEWIKKDGAVENIAVTRDDKTDHLRFRFPYLIKISEVETKGKVPVTIMVLVTPRIVNASRALFESGGEWLTNLSAAVQSATRDWVGMHELEEITQAQNETNSGYVKYILDLNIPSQNNQGLEKLFGIQIDVINFLSYELAGGAQERLEKATTEQYVAAQEAVAAEEKAKGQAKSITIVAEAEAKAMTIKGSAKAKAVLDLLNAISSHPEGAQIEMMRGVAEAIQNSKLTTLVVGEGATPLLQIPNTLSGGNNKAPDNNQPTKNSKKKKGGDDVIVEENHDQTS